MQTEIVGTLSRMGDNEKSQPRICIDLGGDIDPVQISMGREKISSVGNLMYKLVRVKINNLGYAISVEEVFE